MDTENNTTRGNRSTYLWGTVTVLLAAALCAQTYVTYRMYTANMRQAQGVTTTQPADARATPQNSMPLVAQAQPQDKDADDSVADDKTLRSSAIDALKAPSANPQKGLGRSQMGGISINGGSPLIQMFGQNDPFEDMARLRQMMDQMSQGFFSSGVGPSSQMGFGGMTTDDLMGSTESFLDKDGNYVVKLDLPGYDKSDIKAMINDDTLVISAKKNATVKNTSKNALRRSHESSQFQSSFMLPQQVDPKKMKIDYDKGVLTVTVPTA